jgi:uncharacterized protein YndB with AHSA1/START domain
MSEQVSVSKEIAAPAEQVWAMVADVTRMPEWSPENEGGTWVGGATGPAVGAKFKGTNRNGKRKWNTVATVVDADAGRRFSFRVDAAFVKVSEWSYDFEPTANGCRVTETWTERRPGYFKKISELATGVPNLRGVKRVTPEEIAGSTIDALKVPRFDVWAPRRLAAIIGFGAMIPRSWREAVSRAMNSNRVVATDPRARAAYEARANASSPAADEVLEEAKAA